MTPIPDLGGQVSHVFAGKKAYYIIVRRPPSYNSYLVKRAIMSEKPVRQQSLAQQVIEILSERIDSGTYLPNSRLPAESNLVNELEVSRATIRRAIDVLETKGKVIRRHGIGTFVSAATKISNPINEPILFQKLIENSGYSPGVIYQFAESKPASIETAQALEINVGDEVVEFHKIFTADGEHVIYLVNIIPEWVLGEAAKKELINSPEVTEPIFDFLRDRCDQDLIYYLSTMSVDTMGNCPCKGVLFERNTPALLFDEVGHNQDDIPIMHSIHYYPGDKMKFSLVRRRV